MIHLVQILLVLIAILARMITILVLMIVLVILFAMISTNAMMILITAVSMHLVPMILEVSLKCRRMGLIKTEYNKNAGFCSDDATCNNTEGTFSRSCNTGYKDDICTAYVGKVCGDIEECGTFRTC